MPHHPLAAAWRWNDPEDDDDDWVDDDPDDDDDEVDFTGEDE